VTELVALVAAIGVVVNGALAQLLAYKIAAQKVADPAATG
jgi:hypothetical protein